MTSLNPIRAAPLVTPPLADAAIYAEASRRFAKVPLSGRLDLDKILKAFSVRLQVISASAEELATDALLVPVISGFVVAFTQNASRGENDFSFCVAHEIGHTLFYDLSQRIPTRFSSYDEDEERFCDAFASFLLMPRRDTKSMRYPNILELEEEYGIPIEVVGRRFRWSLRGLRVVA